VADGRRPKGETDGRSERGGTAADRLWPVLLDRLTDDAPDQRKEAPAAVVMTRGRFRESVLRDLRWLLNTINSESHIDFSAAEHARRSVLNFGLAPLAGIRSSDVDREELEASIRSAIVQFEPRVLPDTLEVRVISGRENLDLHNVLGIEIRGQLWSVPYPLEMLLRSDIDLETGHIVLHDEIGGAP
jgi:type VI secretion system protein ImpF